MKTLHRLSAAFLGWVIASSAAASILDLKSLAIDFTDAGDAAAKATWSEPEKIIITANGLGRDGEATSSRDGWIQTIPMALGYSWRPPHGASVRVSIQPKLSGFVLNSGQTSTPYAGDVYVRYSPDLRHWSTWQALQTSEPQNKAEKENPGRYFNGVIGVPHVEREEYGRLISQYSKLDVPWTSDEDAAVRWIINRDPEFFARQLPFVGYIQFRYEAGFYGGQRITSFRADVSYGMSGMFSSPKETDAPKDKDALKDLFSKPWSFKAEKNGPSDGRQPRPETRQKPSAGGSRR